MGLADVALALGGSAADNDISGAWQVFDLSGASGAGVVVSVLFPSTRVSFAYQNGYTPTQITGQITKVDGRKVLEIDLAETDPARAEATATQMCEQLLANTVIETYRLETVA